MESSESISMESNHIKDENIAKDVNAAASLSTFYLNIISKPSINLALPSPKLIILDLNGTLCFRKKTRSKNKNYRIILRPFINEFINYLFDNYLVMIWSTSRPENVDKMVSLIFGDQKEKLIAVWARDKFGFTKEEYERDTKAIKNLDIIWKALNTQTESPDNLILDPTNTILIDDSRYKAQLQPFNAIHPRGFNRERVGKGGDSELTTIIKYLEVVKYQSNVAAYMKDHPFTDQEQLIS
ncbi:3792_t:CDS:1 [Funneliformis geosporum]|uniref:Mitochondrial import inner membrane translocase subunit TIM50 n=1 Tax=Funneliformis geosporum TaxID=1117311 RepID=A0A9W4T413_9GLOM|nr:18485_t:CDS:1 [Funneliformis geosporum]CAI2195603.1 3792_t:CDS:1 [Funneliformis geosporum]